MCRTWEMYSTLPIAGWADWEERGAWGPRDQAHHWAHSHHQLKIKEMHVLKMVLLGPFHLLQPLWSYWARENTAKWSHWSNASAFHNRCPHSPMSPVVTKYIQNKEYWKCCTIINDQGGLLLLCLGKVLGFSHRAISEFLYCLTLSNLFIQRKISWLAGRYHVLNE